MDFFAGSATTAEAVLGFGKKINFILVQLPEVLDEKNARDQSEKQLIKKGIEFLKKLNKPLNLAEISKERIRRALKQLKSKEGFKVFKLDKSNYKIWEKYEGKDAKELKKQLELFKTPLISGYKNENVIYECMIKEGYSLNSKIEKTDIKSNNIFKVTDGDLFFYISLDQDIKDKTITELKLKKENMFICLDEALNDSKKKNLSIQCNLKVI